MVISFYLICALSFVLTSTTAYAADPPANYFNPGVNIVVYGNISQSAAQTLQQQLSSRFGIPAPIVRNNSNFDAIRVRYPNDTFGQQEQDLTQLINNGQFADAARAVAANYPSRGGVPVQEAPPSLDRPFDVQEQSLKGLAAAIFQFGTILCIIAAAIYISIGSFYYFAAAGNAALAARGKEIIQRSIIGLLLALIAWVLLKAISPQFVELKNPEFRRGGQQQGG